MSEISVMKLQFDNILDKSNINKCYYVTTKTNNNIILYIISIKKLDDKLFLYLYNTITNINELIHVFNIDQNIKQIEKYIQISDDQKVISIPDENRLYIFLVGDLIKYNTLKLHNCNIKLTLNNDISKIGIQSTTDKTVYCENMQSTVEPHKCMLYTSKYIIITKSGKIVNYDFRTKTIKILNISGNVHNLSFPNGGNHLLLCNNKKNQCRG